MICPKKHFKFKSKRFFRAKKTFAIRKMPKRKNEGLAAHQAFTKARDNDAERCLADCLEKLKKRKITHEDFTNLYYQKLVEYRFNIHTIARKFTKIKKTNPEIRHPSENDEKIRRAKHANEDARHDNPAVLDVTLLLEKIIVGLKCALEKKLYPQIQFCLSFLVCTRPDDFNCKKIRTNGGTLEHWNNVRVFHD